MGRVLYEVSFIGNIQNWFGIIFSIGILIVGVATQRKNSKMDRSMRIAITTIMIAFIAIYARVVLISCAGTLIPYKNGHYIEIEGAVQDYSPNFGNTRGTIESFTLDGVKFKCSDGNIWGYCPDRKNGGVIAGNGQHLRIRYVSNLLGNTIMYIEQMMPEEWEED